MLGVPTYEITDDGDDLQLSMLVGEYQVASALVPLLVGDDEAYVIARNLGEAWLQMMRPRSVGLSQSKS